MFPFHCLRLFRVFEFKLTNENSIQELWRRGNLEWIKVLGKVENTEKYQLTIAYRNKDTHYISGNKSQNGKIWHIEKTRAKRNVIKQVISVLSINLDRGWRGCGERLQHRSKKSHKHKAKQKGSISYHVVYPVSCLWFSLLFWILYTKELKL